MIYLIAITCLMAAMGALLMRSRRVRRTRLLEEVFDSADKFEQQLYACRDQLGELQPFIDQETTQSHPVRNNAGAQVQLALRDLLAHRLWLRDHAARASLAEIADAHEALHQSRIKLAGQLAQLDVARDDLQLALRDMSERVSSDRTTG